RYSQCRQHRLRQRTAQPQQCYVRTLGKLNLLADQEVIEMIQHALAWAGTWPRHDIEPEGLLLLQSKNADEDMGDDTCLGSAEERLATCAACKILHVVRTEVLQKRRCIRPGHFYDAGAEFTQAKQGGTLA